VPKFIGLSTSGAVPLKAAADKVVVLPLVQIANPVGVVESI
jgi:hypothetical protein